MQYYLRERALITRFRYLIEPKLAYFIEPDRAMPATPATQLPVPESAVGLPSNQLPNRLAANCFSDYHHFSKN